MSAARSRGTTSRSGKKSGGKEAPPSAADLKKEKQKHDFESVATAASERAGERRATVECERVALEQWRAGRVSNPLLL
jgi:hypothetical protein